MDTDLSIVPPTEAILVKPKVAQSGTAQSETAQSEPATGRALWPTFMRRTLADEALDIAALTPRPTAR